MEISDPVVQMFEQRQVLVREAKDKSGAQSRGKPLIRSSGHHRLREEVSAASGDVIIGIGDRIPHREGDSAGVGPSLQKASVPLPGRVDSICKTWSSK